MFCEKCGNELKDNEKFCTQCGASVQETDSEVKQEAAPEATSAEEEVQAQASEEAQETVEKKVEEAVAGEEVAEAAGDAKEDATAEEVAGGVKKFFGDKKKLSFIIGGVAVLVLILIVASGASLNNFVHKVFTAPEKYYRHVEKDTVKDISKSLAEMYATDGFRAVLGVDYANIHDNSMGIDVNVELGEEGQELIELAGLAGVDLSWLESVKLGMDASIKGDIVSLGVTSNLNKDDILSGNLILDMEDVSMYVQVPELSKKYIGLELEEMLSDYEYEEIVAFREAQAINKKMIASLPAQAKVEKLLNKYINIALGCVEDVEKGSKTLKVEGIQQKCTQLDVTIDGKTMADMVKAVATELVNDKEVKKIIAKVVEAREDLDMDADEAYESFVERIEYMAENAERYADRDFEISMKVYVDGKGNVVGRKIEVEEYYSFVEIAMLMPEKGGKFGYEFSVEENGGKIQVTGSGKRSGDTISGDFEAGYNGASVVEIKVKKLNTKDLVSGKVNGGFEVVPSSKIIELLNGYGSYTVASILSDLSVKVDTEMKNKSAEVIFDISYDDKKVGKINVACETGKGSSAKAPGAGNTIIVEDEDSLIEWLESINWDKVVTRLDKTDIPSEIVEIVEEIGEIVEDEDFDELRYLLY